MDIQEEEDNGINRYPGIQPFSEKYQNVFYGRDDDIEEVEKMLRIHRLMVVFGKSGLGKSSLFNAGLIPLLNDQKNYHSFFIRFGSYNPEYPKILKDIFVQRVQQELPPNQKIFFSELGLDYWDHSLWQWVQTLHWNRRNDTILIVLDQFEELFSYPEKEVEAFMDEFSEIINDRMPEAFRKALYERIENDPDFADKYADEIELIDNESKTRVIMGIRSDRLSLLDRFSIYLPNILKNNYELNALTRDQAQLAITAPAANNDEAIQFKSPVFEYEEDFLENLLDFLSLNGSKPVETFLLQIICQHIEDWVSLNKEHADLDIEVNADDIQDLNSVVKEYYVNVVRGVNLKTKKSTFTEHDQILTRYFIEDNLIDRMHNNRISLDMALVKQNGMYDELIQRLIDVRVIRQEPNTVSGISYELSHDTLIDPILNSESVLGSLEDNIDKYYRAYVDVERQRFIEQHFLTRERKLKRIAHSELDQSDIDTLTQLAHSKIIRDFSLPDEDDSKFEVYPMFQGSVLKFRAELDDTKFNKERNRRRRAVLTSIAAVLLTIVSVFSTIYAFTERARANSNSNLITQKNKLLSIKTDSLRIKKDLADTLTKQANIRAAEAERQKKKADSLLEESKRLTQILRVNNINIESQKTGIQQSFIEQKEELAEIKEVAAEKDEEIQKLAAEVADNTEFVQSIYSKSTSALDQNPTLALRLAEYAYNLKSDNKDYLDLLYKIIGDRQNNFYLRNLTGHTDDVRALDISQNGDLIVTASGKYGKKVIVWNVHTGVGNEFMKYHQGSINAVKFFQNDTRIVTGASDKFIALWTLQGQGIISKNMGSSVTSISSAANLDHILVSVRKGTNNVGKIYILDDTFTALKEAKRSKVGMGSVFASINKDLFISGSNFDRVFLWEFEKDRRSRIFTGCESGVNDVRLSPDGRQILANCTKDYSAMIWDINDKNPRFKFQGAELGTSVEFGLGVTPETIFIATSTGQIQERRIKDNSIIRTFKGHDDRINKIQRSYKTSGANEFLVSVSRDKTVKIWPLEMSVLRESIIDKYEKGLPVSQVLIEIQNFLKNNQAAILSKLERTEYQLSDQ